MRGRKKTGLWTLLIKWVSAWKKPFIREVTLFSFVHVAINFEQTEFTVVELWSYWFQFAFVSIFANIVGFSVVIYHSGPTFGQFLYSCHDAFAVDASDYSGHLIRHLLNAAEAFPTEWFLQFWEQVEVWWAYVRTVRRVGKHLSSILFQKFPILHLRHEAARYRTKWGHRLRTWRTVFGESLDAKHLADTFRSMPLLQWTPEAHCLLLWIHSCRKP
jgi:hypothetical protein